MAKTVYNKNVANPSDVSASIFSSDEQLKYGEIVLCNNIDEPGIYIFTKSNDGETKIQKMNSVDNIILKQDVDPSASGPVANGDTLYEMVSKFQNQIDNLSGDGESEAKKVNKIIAAVDINEDGSYKIISGNYVGDATSIADAISKLDAAIDTVSGSSVKEAKEYTDTKITESIKALDAETSAGEGEVFVKITEADGLVSGEVKALSVEKDATGLKYDLKLGDYVFGSVDIPQDQFLKEVIFISAATVEDIAEALNYGQSIELGKPYLKFVWKLEEGLKPTYVDVSGLIDVYTAADVKLSDAYTGTSFDIKSGGTLEDAVGKITKELTSIEENITANEITSSGKTILVQSSETGTNIDINIDGDTIVTDKTVAGEGKISVKLEVEKKYIDSGYVRTQYILKSSGSTYGVINDTRDVVVGDGDEYIKVATEQVSDVEGNRTDKLKITPTIQKNINNATSESVDDGNGLVTAWGVKSYIRDGMDGDGIMVGDDILQPHDKYYGAINFDGQSLTYDTVHEGFYKIDNNANRLAESIGFDFGHQESGITPNEILAYPGNNNAEAVEKTHFSAATNIMEALISLDDNQPFEWGKGEKAIQSVGTACSATGDYSFAVGYETLASGNKSHAEGAGSQAIGNLSHAEGSGTTANGDYSHAEGRGTITNNEAEHASGKYNNSTEGDQIFSIGIGSGDDDRKNAIEVHSAGTIFGEAILTTSGDVMSVTSTGKLADALTIKTLVDNMDYTADTEENKVFTGITQTNGHVAVTSENLTRRKLAGYQVVAVTNPSDESAKVATTDTLGQGLGKLQGQINAMDKATQAEENSIIYDVTERDGKVSATSKHIVDIKLSGYTVGDTTSGKISSGDTLGQALGKLQGQVNGLDWTGTTTSNEVFTGITENDGKVSATTALITSRTLSGYSATANTKVAATQTLGQALGSLQGQINSLDYTADTSSDKVFTYVAQSDGKLTASAENITNRVITGYAEGTDADVAETDTLGQALGKLQKQINSLDYTANTGSDKVFTYVAEADGKLTTSAESITSRVITGYAEGSDAKIASTDTLGGALGKIQGQINAMDKATQAEENSVIYDVTERDGKVSATSKHIVDIKLSGYTEGATTSGKISSGDTLGQALGKLQGQVNGLDYTADTGSDKVFTYVAQSDGKLTTSAESITSRVITGYAEGIDADVAETDTLGVALGKLQKQINSMDYTANAGSDKVFTYVAEADGKLTTSAANITSRVITGYAVGSDAKIAATDTLGGALGKVQGQINAMDKAASSETGKFVRTVTEADGKVSETRGYIVADDVKVTSATAAEISTLGANVKEAYKVVNNQGTQLGDWVKIYKDSSLNSVTLSGDSSTTGQWMIFNYTYADGTTGNTAVDISKFLVQAEFKSGVTADNSGIVHGVVSGNSESVVTAYTATGGANGTAKVLGVNGGGFYVNNIQTAINAKVNNAISLLDSSSATTNAGYYMTGITITDGKVTAIGQAKLTSQETELTTGNSTTATGNAVIGLSVSDHAITLNKKNFPEVAWKRVSAAGANIDATTTADTISIVTGNTGITLVGDATNKKITISHTDTSSQSSVDAGSGKFIKSVSVDTYGHVTGLTTGNTVDNATMAADSAKVAGKTVGNANGNVPLSNGTVNTNLNADMIDGKHVAIVSAIPSSPDANTIYILS